MSGFNEEEQSQESGFDPGTLIRVFLRRKWLFFVPFVLCLGMAYIAIKTMVPIYESSGLLHIEVSQTVSRSLSEGVPRYGRSRNPDREIEVRIRNHLANQVFMEGVVREYQLVDLEAYLGPRERPGPDEIDREISKLARRLKSWTKVEITDTHIFKIGVRHTNAALVDTFATAVITSVVHQEQQSRQDRVEGEKVVLERQRDQFQNELNSLQNRLSRFERNLESRNLSDSEITSGNRAAARQQLTDMRARAASGEIGDRTQMRRAANAALPAVNQLLSELGEDSAFASAIEDIASLEFDLAIAKANNDSRWRDMEEQRQGVLGGMREDLAHHVQREYDYMTLTDQSSVVDFLQDMMHKDGLDTAVRELNGKIEAFAEFEHQQPGQSAALDNLTRQITTAQDNLDRVKREISTLELSIDASMSDIGYHIAIQSKPEPAYDPVEPDKKKLAMMGVVLALAIGVGLVMLAEMIDRSFKTINQIESMLRVKVIGTLPKAEYGPFEKMRRRRRVLLWIVIILAIAAIAAVGFLWIYPKMSS